MTKNFAGSATIVQEMEFKLMMQKPDRGTSVLVFELNIGDANIKLNRQQLDARNSIRFLDDIFQFGYALRYSHHDFSRA